MNLKTIVEKKSARESFMHTMHAVVAEEKRESILLEKSQKYAKVSGKGKLADIAKTKINAQLLKRDEEAETVGCLREQFEILNPMKKGRPNIEAMEVESGELQSKVKKRSTSRKKLVF